MKPRAGIYARNSVDKKDSTTIEDQLSMCRDYAQARGFEVAHEYTDPGISGVAVANRPQFLAMMEAAKVRGFQELLVMDMTRFSRDPGDSSKQLDLLLYYKVRVHDVTKEISTDNENFRTLVDIDNVVSRITVKSASKKSHYNLRGKAMRGEATGSCPYGYRSVVRPDGKKGLEVVPEEADVVLRIFQMMADGMAGKAIAHILNSEGVPSPAKTWARKTRRTDGMWHPAAIIGDPKKFVGIIHNEVYIGRVVWNRTKWAKSPLTGKREREVLPEAQWIRTEAPELRIVDDLSWRRVRDRVRATQERTNAARARVAAMVVGPRRGRYSGKNPSQIRADGPVRYVLSGLLRCGVCGSNFAMADSTKYACASRTNCGPKACANNQRFRRVDAERLLLADLAQELRGGEALRAWVAEVERELKAQQSAPSPADTLRRQLAEVDVTITNLVDAISSGALRSSAALAERLRAAEETRRTISERLEIPHLLRPGSVSLAVREASREFARMLEDLPAHLSDPEIVQEARTAIRDWMGDITIEPSKIGPMARWRLAQSGLLLATGRMAPMVAGVGFEPTTFGL